MTEETYIFNPSATAIRYCEKLKEFDLNISKDVHYLKEAVVFILENVDWDASH